jgi:hypothetical protein
LAQSAKNQSLCLNLFSLDGHSKTEVLASFLKFESNLLGSFSLNN